MRGGRCSAPLRDSGYACKGTCRSFRKRMPERTISSLLSYRTRNERYRATATSAAGMRNSIIQSSQFAGNRFVNPSAPPDLSTAACDKDQQARQGELLQASPECKQHRYRVKALLRRHHRPRWEGDARGCGARACAPSLRGSLSHARCLRCRSRACRDRNCARVVPATHRYVALVNEER